MCRSILRACLASVHVAALVVLAGIAIAAGSGQHKIADGMFIYLGVVPAEIVRGHPLQHNQVMHGGVPAFGQDHHVIIALFDNQSADRIIDAAVRAIVEESDHSGRLEKELEPMTVAGTITYGNYFRMPGKDPYLISLEIRRLNSLNAVKVQFVYQHP